MIVVDASVVIKWFIKEELHDEARILLPYADRIVAPDFMLVECANIIWAKERRGLITRRQANAILPVLRRSGIQTEASLSLLH